MVVSPGQVLARSMSEISWPFALGVSGAAFALFFFQTGLDRSHVNTLTMVRSALLALLGTVYGTVGIAAIGLVAWALSKFIGGDQQPGWRTSPPTCRGSAIGNCSSASPEAANTSKMLGQGSTVEIEASRRPA